METSFFLDSMKRQQNSLYWPYFGPALLDGDNKIRLGCEAIMCTERLECYQFVVEAMYEMAPSASMADIRIIFGDGIMEESLLVRLGIQGTCHLGYDQYHLLHIDWPLQFGAQLWTILEDSFKQFVYANTEEECEGGLKTIVDKLQGRI